MRKRIKTIGSILIVSLAVLLNYKFIGQGFEYQERMQHLNCVEANSLFIEKLLLTETPEKVVEISNVFAKKHNIVSFLFIGGRLYLSSAYKEGDLKDLSGGQLSEILKVYNRNLLKSGFISLAGVNSNDFYVVFSRINENQYFISLIKKNTIVDTVLKRFVISCILGIFALFVLQVLTRQKGGRQK